MSGFELGIFTFGELTRAPGGTLVTAQERIADVLAWALVADSSGLDVFGVGEHHREDFAISSPQALGHIRFLAQVGLGGLPQADTLAAIELLATDVLPAVRKALGTTSS